jgi:hypothetical protein
MLTVAESAADVAQAAMRKTFTETLLKVDEWLASATEGRATFCVDDVVAVTSRVRAFRAS